MSEELAALRIESAKELQGMRQRFSMTLEPESVLVLMAMMKACMLKSACTPPIVTTLGSAILAGIGDYFSGLPATRKLWDLTVADVDLKQHENELKFEASDKRKLILTAPGGKKQGHPDCNCPLCSELDAHDGEMVIELSAWPVMELLSMFRILDMHGAILPMHHGLIIAVTQAAQEFFKGSPRALELVGDIATPPPDSDSEPDEQQSATGMH